MAMPIPVELTPFHPFQRGHCFPEHRLGSGIGIDGGERVTENRDQDSQEKRVGQTGERNLYSKTMSASPCREGRA